MFLIGREEGGRYEKKIARWVLFRHIRHQKTSPSNSFGISADNLDRMVAYKQLRFPLSKFFGNSPDHIIYRHHKKLMIFQSTL